MKKFITLIAIAAATLAAVQVNAQYALSDPKTTDLNGGTNNVVGATTNTYAIVVDIQKQSHTGFQVTAKYDGACTGTALLSFARTVDGTTYETTPGITLTTAAGNGTTLVTTFGVQQVDGIQKLKLVSIGNTNAAALTNITFKYLIKR